MNKKTSENEMFWKKVIAASENALNRFAKLLLWMLLFWFSVPLFTGILEQALCGKPIVFSELVLPALSTPFLLWHRLGFLFSEYCFDPAFSEKTGDVIALIFIIFLGSIHTGCFVLTVLCSIKPKLAYWLPLAIILAAGSIRMADCFAVICGV